MTHTIPQPIQRIANHLINAGYEAFLVGGCVRDLIRGVEPNDWDLTTNVSPETMVEIFEAAGEKVVYENNFGTVMVINEDRETTDNLYQVEITPYRTEGTYTDKRRPDNITFAKTLTEDLIRRDFTINALALNPSTGEITDMFDGQDDLKKGIMRAVGNPDERFTEDALRLLRAVRFAAQLDFTIEPVTRESVARHANLIQHVSHERIRDEFIKLMMSNEPMRGLNLLRELNLAEYIIPELLEGYEIDQSRSHIYDVWEHNLRAGDNAAKQSWPLHIRLAALFHDVGKPRTRRWDKSQNLYTFYGHEVVGARMVKAWLERMKFPKKLSQTVVKLVRHHMFFSDPDKITLAAVRRMIRNVGKEHIWDLMLVRRSDRIGMGRKKADPYRLRMYESMIEEALRDPIDVSMLAMNGDIMIAELGMKPGREIGWILHALLEEVLDDPTRNTTEYLRERTLDLMELDRETLKTLGERGKQTQEQADEAAVAELRKKHKVKMEGKRSKR